ncbi:MAG: glycosyltransferase, partial [Gammaproteobacteria bacterium]
MTDGEDGLLVPLEDPAALAQCVEDVLAGGESDRLRIAANGQRLVATRHSRAAIVGQYLALYRALRG